MKKDGAMSGGSEDIRKRMIEFEKRELEFRELYLRRERSLNEMYVRFRNPSSTLGTFFLNTGIQVRIFQYEATVELGSLLRNRPEGFAKAVAVKGLIHKIVEFNLHLEETMQPNMLKIARERGFDFDEKDKNELRRRWRSTFKEIRKWQKIRNKATGHYDADLAEVVELLECIDVEKVKEVFNEFVNYAKALMDRFIAAGS
ncbi:hypothetical protein [Burkholderia gladioli]|uniref:hypothetical protein n=1 Tax=Burkholderia gladioli TaxID=28095 RepID=UPI001641C41F|nr:hypothetical protein [Burkholderia gladioli]